MKELTPRQILTGVFRGEISPKVALEELKRRGIPLKLPEDEVALEILTALGRHNTREMWVNRAEELLGCVPHQLSQAAA